MNELTPVYALATMIGALIAFQVLTRRFDPFAPIWLFLVGIVHVYVIQALSYHEWAVRVRGTELVGEANFRALWAIAWALAVYFLWPGRAAAKVLPRPPTRWGAATVQVVTPLLLVWGLACTVIVAWFWGGADGTGPSAEAALLLQFPMIMVVAGVILIITGRQPTRPRPWATAAGVGTVVSYMLLWMFIGKRSHSLFAVLTGVCAFYVARLRRPSWPVLIATALVGSMAVGLSIGWRYYSNKEAKAKTIADFVGFVATFDPSTILESVNLSDGDTLVRASYETEEIGGFYLMMDTVPLKADYDYGASYLRVFSTFIPRLVWADKPIFGREKWVAAWIAGSEQKRELTFTGPSIGLLGATQLNGGAWATLIVLGLLGATFRTGYEYFRMHADVPWVQAWWTLTYYNAWLLTVGDDPCTWFYLNYAFTTMPPLILTWLLNRGDAPA